MSTNTNNYPRDTVISLPSFNKDKNSAFSSIQPNSSVSNSSEKGTYIFKHRTPGLQNTDTIKSTAGNYNPNNHNSSNSNGNTFLSIYNSTPDPYVDFFTKNEYDWDIIRKWILAQENINKSVSLDKTPSFYSCAKYHENSFNIMGLSNNGMNRTVNDNRGKNFHNKKSAVKSNTHYYTKKNNNRNLQTIVEEKKSFK
jgi:hypothetical protein